MDGFMLIRYMHAYYRPAYNITLLIFRNRMSLRKQKKRKLKIGANIENRRIEKQINVFQSD